MHHYCADRDVVVIEGQAGLGDRLAHEALVACEGGRVTFEPCVRHYR
jgi:hypothetical protein